MLELLLLKDWWSVRNVRKVLPRQSLFKLVFIAAFVFGFTAGMWALFLDGFRFLEELGGMGLMIIHRLFALFFFGLGLMLVLSGMVSAYSTIYRSEETEFLLLRPVSVESVLTYKFLETVLFSSWAFFFIIVPFVGAYAWHQKLSLLFSFWTFFYSVPFVMLCSGVGVLVVLVFMRWLPAGRWALRLAGLAVAALLWWGWRTFSVGLRMDVDTNLVLARIIPGLRAASFPLLPGWWVSEGIMSMSRGRWLRGLMFWGVLVSNLAMLVMIMRAAARGVFLEGWRRSLSHGRRRVRREILLGGLDDVRILPVDIRAMILKDLRIFLRDPVQWGQTLFFFGLLALYFLNLRSLHYHVLPAAWRNMIAFLNVFSISAVLSSFGSRFIYPQLSLEGHSFWILGLAPSSMGRILAAKFVASAAAMLAVSLGLMSLALWMLRIAPPERWVSLGMAAAVSLGVAGLSTGLGAIFMDLRERNPAAIVSGFGGTLNLVLSLTFIILGMGPFGFIFHLHQRGLISDAGLGGWLAAAGLWLVLLTAAATVIPLLVGRRSLEHREY